MGQTTVLLSPQPEASRRRTPVVLLVDDDPAVLAAARRALRSEAYELVTATDAQAALELVGIGGIDVIVADQRMPGMTGFTLLDLAQERSPSTKRAIWTGDARGIEAFEGWQGIIQCVVKKEDGSGELRSVLRQFLAGWKGI